MPESLPRAEVSVIIPCYRCCDTIERAVESVAGQTMPTAEVILVDDRSDDGTLVALYALRSRYPEGWIRIIEQPQNRGPGEARNAGWEQAGQPYIAFLDADDTWHARKIEIQFKWMSEHPDVALSGHAAPVLRSVGERSSIPTLDPEAVAFYPITKHRLLWANPFPTPTVMLRRDLGVRFSEGKSFSEDYLLWMMIACSGRSLSRCDLPLAFLHKEAFGEGGLSANLWKMQKGQLGSYIAVYDSGCVRSNRFFFVLAWSLLRFIRRLVLTPLRRLKKTK